MISIVKEWIIILANSSGDINFSMICDASINHILILEWLDIVNHQESCLEIIILANKSTYNVCIGE